MFVSREWVYVHDWCQDQPREDAFKCSRGIAMSDEMASGESEEPTERYGPTDPTPADTVFGTGDGLLIDHGAGEQTIVESEDRPDQTKDE